MANQLHIPFNILPYSSIKNKISITKEHTPVLGYFNINIQVMTLPVLRCWCLIFVRFQPQSERDSQSRLHSSKFSTHNRSTSMWCFSHNGVSNYKCMWQLYILTNKKTPAMCNEPEHTCQVNRDIHSLVVLHSLCCIQR